MTEAIPIRTARELWPDHAGHLIIYSEHGRTDHLLRSLEAIDEFEGTTTWIASDYDEMPYASDIESTEYWCRTCGVPLNEQTEE